jgi:hypothetical protein
MKQNFQSAVDAIISIVGDKKPSDLSVADLRRVFRIACNALNASLDVQALERDLRPFKAPTPETKREIAATLGSLDRFAQFMKFEEKLFLENGTIQNTCNRLMNVISAARETAVRELPTPEEVVLGIRNLQQIICKMADELDVAAANLQKEESAREMVTGASKAVVGVLVIKLNASAAVATMGFSGVSVILGWEPIKSFLKRFW